AGGQSSNRHAAHEYDDQHLPLPRRRRRRQMNVRQLLIAGLIPLLLTGCMDEKQNLQAFVADVRSRPSPPIEPIPPMGKYIPFTYATNDRRPPFTRVVAVPVAVNAAGNTIKPDIN